MRIWHDNSGKGDLASWFLKHLIIHDLQTREKFYFLCQDWLAVEKSDEKLERELFVACEPQKSNLNYLMRTRAKNYLNEYHIWYSVFRKPLQSSSFQRFDRVMCCFNFLYCAMLLNIVYNYYLSGANMSTNSIQLNFYFFKLGLEQVKKNLLTNYSYSSVNQIVLLQSYLLELSLT